jgi:hypothetical protein
MGVDARTHGELMPTVTQMRKRMNEVGPQPTSILDAQRAVESYRRVKGRERLRYLVRWTTQGVKEAIARGRMLQVAIDYATFNRLMAAGKTGDPHFTGGHSVAVYGRRVKDGRAQVLLFDPLDDQRRPEIAGPAPRWIPERVLIESMERFAGGDGRAQAGIFLGGQPR